MGQYQWMVACTLVLVLAIQIAGCRMKDDSSAQTATPPTDVSVGSTAPDFHLPLLNGGEMGLSELRGRVVLINFWATWCTPCRVEMPAMEMLYQDFRNKGLEILAVSIDIAGESEIHPFVQELNLTFPVLLDSEFLVEEAYEVRVVPTSFLIDRKGMVVDRFLGAKDWYDAESRFLVRQLLEAEGSS